MVKKLGIALAIVACIIVTILLITKNDADNNTNEPTGVIVEVGDNNNDNNGDKINVDNSNKDDDKEDEVETTEAPKEVIEELGKIAGNWAAYDGGTVMEFIPARGNEAALYFPHKDLQLRCTYETDDKTYIKIDYYNLRDTEVTGTMTLKIINMEIDMFGELMLTVEEEDGTVYYLSPAS